MIKYYKLKNVLSGGEFRTNILNCKEIEGFCQDLFGVINEHGLNLIKINEVYHTYFDYLFDDEKNIYNILLLANINFLLDINLDSITNEIIREKIRAIYIKKHYNSSSREINFINVPDETFNEKIKYQNIIDPLCFENIDVWNTDYILEDFWRSDIHEFMDEYDNFEKTEQSYFLYWMNLINISSLLCKLKTCNCYLTKIAHRDNYIHTPENFKQLHKNGEIHYITQNKKKDLNLRELKIMYPNIKYMCLFITISTDKYFELIKLLLNSFNCHYDNIKILYENLICTLLPIENINEGIEDSADLLQDIKKLCNGQDNGNYYLYLSLILPADHKYARNEYTKICCTSINPLNLIDNVVLSIDQIIGHDLTFHAAIQRKITHSDDVKVSFRQFIAFIDYCNGNKENLNKKLKEYIFKLNPVWINDNRMLYFHYNKLLSDCENYDYNNLFAYVHFLFHEIKNSNPFTQDNLIIEINYIISSITSVNILTRNYNFRLEMIMFIIIYIQNNSIKINPNLQSYLNYNIKLALYSIILHDLNNSVSKDLKNSVLKVLESSVSEDLKTSALKVLKDLKSELSILNSEDVINSVFKILKDLENSVSEDLKSIVLKDFKDLENSVSVSNNLKSILNFSIQTIESDISQLKTKNWITQI